MRCSFGLKTIVKQLSTYRIAQDLGPSSTYMNTSCLLLDPLCFPQALKHAQVAINSHAAGYSGRIPVFIKEGKRQAH